MSWTYINRIKFIFDTVNYRYDYKEEYNMNHIITSISKYLIF